MTNSYPDGNPKSVFGSRKVNLYLNPASAIIYMALGFMEGAKKYGPYNWRKTKVAASVYIAALERHIQDYKDGHDIDPSSGRPILSHILANGAILVDATENNCLIDDRPPLGNAPNILAKFKRDKDDD